MAKGQMLGILELDQRKLEFVATVDNDFKALTRQAWEQGIMRIRDIYDPEKQTFVMVEERISSSEENFPLAFKEYLERQGYEVIEEHSEIAQKIKELLSQFPDDNPDKIDILNRLPEMSYLEQTAILEGLKGEKGVMLGR